MSFFDRFKPGNKKNKSGMPNMNIFSKFQLPGQNNFSGSGQSLGGSQPGKVIDVQLDDPGPLGVKIEKRPNSQGTAIVAMVVAGSQADKAGMQRGDILCFSGSNGTEEIMYDMFIQLAASDQRPLCFEIRRVQSKATAKNATGNNSASSSSSSSSLSAEAYARKQAVIAAAEKRDKAHKSKYKPTPKTKSNLPALLSTAERQRLEEERLARVTEMANQEPMTEASRKAREEAKNREAANAAQLGYNPYETNRATAGQARSATVAQSHGTMQGTGDGSESARLPAVRAPADTLDAKDDDILPSSYFSESFESVVTSNENAAAISSVGIMRKLIVNATTKGQNHDDEVLAAKFRRVRLANAKIKAAIVDVEGALDVMLSAGFQLVEEDGESVLIFPPGANIEDWLPAALKQMELYENS
jgi:hypothetical protein